MVPSQLAHWLWPSGNTVRQHRCSIVKHLEQNKDIPKCHFVLNAPSTSTRSPDLVEWINRHSSGVTIDSFESSRSLNMRLLRASRCFVFVDGGRNVTQAIAYVNGMAVRNKVLYFDLSGNEEDLGHLPFKKLSFDVVLMTSRQGNILIIRRF